MEPAPRNSEHFTSAPGGFPGAGGLPHPRKATSFSGSHSQKRREHLRPTYFRNPLSTLNGVASRVPHDRLCRSRTGAPAACLPPTPSAPAEPALLPSWPAARAVAVVLTLKTARRPTVSSCFSEKATDLLFLKKLIYFIHLRGGRHERDKWSGCGFLVSHFGYPVSIRDSCEPSPLNGDERHEETLTFRQDT